MFEWRDTCGHNYFIDEQGYCKCKNIGCTTNPIFIGSLRFNCKTEKHKSDNNIGYKLSDFISVVMVMMNSINA
jgi:hypothetical protein